MARVSHTHTHSFTTHTHVHTQTSNKKGAQKQGFSDYLKLGSRLLVVMYPRGSRLAVLPSSHF